MGRACGAQRPGGARPALHRPAPDPRGDQPAGVRRAPRRRAPGAPTGPHPGHRGPQRPDHRYRQADRRPDLPGPGRRPACERRGVRRADLLAGQRRAGHRPRGRPAAGPDPAGHDDRLRRLAHLHPRCVRCPRVRDRHLGGRARPGHADPAAQAVQDDGDHGRGRTARRGHGQGPDPGGHRPDRHRGRPGLRPGVPRRGDPGAEHGGPDDHLQHVHRGRCARRDDRPRRDDLRLHRGPAEGARGQGLVRCGGPLADAEHRRRCAVRRRGGDRRQ